MLEVNLPVNAKRQRNTQVEVVKRLGPDEPVYTYTIGSDVTMSYFRLQ